MKKMKKKLMAMLLMTGMAISGLSGCGIESADRTAQTGKSTSFEEKSGEVEDAQEIATVTWVIRCNKQDDDEEVMEALNQILREKYSLELNLISVTESEYNDRMNLMITSGEDWDLCYTAHWSNKFHDNVNRGAFLELNDLLENTETGRELMAIYPEGLTGIATVNGGIYAIPNYQLIYTQTGAYIQKDLADEFGLDADSIHSIVDLEPFMEWVRDNKEGIWPICEAMSFASAWEGTEGSQIYSNFVGVGVAIDDESLTVVHPMDTEEWYNKYKLLNSYYHRGFIRSDAATAVDITADQAANRYAVTIHTAKPGGEAEYETKYGKEYIQVPFGPMYLDYNAGISTMTAVNVNSRNPEAALKLLSVMWTDKEVYNMLLFGLEGKHYQKVAENRVELIADSGYNRSSYGWMLGNQFNAWLLPGQADDVWEVTEANNQAAEKSVLFGFSPDTTVVSAEFSQVSSVDKEFGKGYRYVENYDEWYNEYLEKRKLAGIDIIVEEMQKQVDVWKEANGK